MPWNSKIPDLKNNPLYLEPRVTAAESQLAEKAKKSDVDTQIAAVASGSPKGVYTTASALQTAFPTGNTNIYLVTGNVKEVDTLNITAAPTTAGNITVTLNGAATNIAVTSGVKEVASLTVTAVPTVAGNVTITLNGVATTVALDPATDTTTDLVATKIRNATYSTGAVTGGIASTVTFTASAIGVKTDATYSAGSTGATGTISTTTQGVDADTTTSVATKIRGTSFSGWTTGGTGTTITFTATAGGTKTAPTYSAGSTGTTGTMSVTTIGVNVDGNWYYWSGSSWTAGGVYQSTSISSKSIKMAKLDDTVIKPLSSYSKMTYTIQSDHYYSRWDGTLRNLNGYQCIKLAVNPSDKLKCTALINGSDAAMAVFYDADGNYLSYLNGGTDGVNTQYTDYEFDVPDNAFFVAIDGLMEGALRLDILSVVNAVGRIETLETNASSYQQMDYTVQSGVYFNSDGHFDSTLTGWKSLKVSVNPSDKLRVNVTVQGGANSMAVFFDINNVRISDLNPGTNGINTPYVNYEFTVPENAYYVAISGWATFDIKLELYGLTQVAEKIVAVENRVTVLEGNTAIDTYWKGKKIAWFGTSIPAGGYPELAGNLLGATIYNEAVGSSCARAGNHNFVSGSDPLGYSGMYYENLMRSLSLSSTEKQSIFDNWSTWKTLIPSAPDMISAQSQSDYKSWSWDVKLNKYLTGGSVGQVDLYVFDHGHNDHGYTIVNGNLVWSDMLVDPPSNDMYNRTYFIGAMNFLIKKILDDNPRARICFIGHYENDRKAEISQAQTKLADVWDYPSCQSWSKLGWSQKTVTTTGYWTGTGLSSVWTPSGGSSQILTLTQIWMQDDLHPYSDVTKNFLATVYADFLKSVR